MQLRNLLIILMLFFVACKGKPPEAGEKFDKVKWASKDGNQYPFRDKMLNDFMTNYKMNGMKKDSILFLLGEPNRRDSLYLFYTVAQKFFANTSWPISTKSLVIKLKSDSTVEWRKIHE